MSKKSIICLLLIWHVLGPLKTFISAFVCARLCVCQNEGECMRERERGRGGEGGQFTWLFIAFMLLLLFFTFFFFTLLYVQYTYSAFVTKLTSSAVTRTEVSSG